MRRQISSGLVASLSLAVASFSVACLDAHPGRSAGGIEGAGEVCGLLETDVSNHYGSFADVTVTNTDTHLIVEVAASKSGLNLLDAYLDATAGNITSSSGGYINYAWFPHQAHYADGEATSHTFVIPLGDIPGLGDTCGASIKVAVFVKFKQHNADGTSQNASGWAAGPNTCEFNWDGCSWSDYDFCDCTPPEEDQGCTRTRGYWGTHNEFARQRGLRVDWPAPMDELDELCGQTLLSILNSSSEGGNVWQIVAAQYIAAQLNLAAGASSTDAVDIALATAEEYLASCDGGSAISDADALDAKDILDAYNNGDLGPGHCD
jgi:hypothetical protein